MWTQLRQDGKGSSLTEQLQSKDEQLLAREQEIAHLKLLLAKLRRMQFGRKSEKVAHQIEQLELETEGRLAEVRLAEVRADEVRAAERVEVSFGSLAWMERIAGLFNGRQGFVVLIDYGYTREEQLAGRNRDTLMTYRRHQANHSPYEAPGEQDITAHVNFTALRSAGCEHGMEPIALLTQSQFLICIGEETQFADAFQECKLPQGRAKVVLQVKHLIRPEAMAPQRIKRKGRPVERPEAVSLNPYLLRAPARPSGCLVARTRRHC